MATDPDRNWQSAAESTLVRLLDRLGELADGCGEPKQIVDAIKTVGEIVTAGNVIKSEDDGGDDGGDDDGE